MWQKSNRQEKYGTVVNIAECWFSPNNASPLFTSPCWVRSSHFFFLLSRSLIPLFQPKSNVERLIYRLTDINCCFLYERHYKYKSYMCIWWATIATGRLHARGKQLHTRTLYLVHFIQLLKLNYLGISLKSNAGFGSSRFNLLVPQSLQIVF